MKLSNIVAISLLGNVVQAVLEGENVSAQDWMVLLKHSLGGFCGGTLYSERMVITAAHCSTYRTRDWKAYPNLELRSRAGSSEHPGIQVLARYNHDLFKYEKAYDVSIWLLNSKTNIRTKVELGEETEFRDMFNFVYFMGWGSINTVTKKDILNEKYILKTVDQLQKAGVPLVYDDTCFIRYPRQFTFGIQFCSGESREGPSAGYGDSGGPIYRVRNKRIILMGIISTGIGCGYKDYKDINVKVSARAIKSFINHYIRHIGFLNLNHEPFTYDIPKFKSVIHYIKKDKNTDTISSQNCNIQSNDQASDTTQILFTPGGNIDYFSYSVPKTPGANPTLPASILQQDINYFIAPKSWLLTSRNKLSFKHRFSFKP